MTSPAPPAEPQPQPRTYTVPMLTVPVSTIIIVIIALVGGIALIVNGNLPDDFRDYAAIVGGSSGLLAIGRGLDSHSKP